MRRYGAGPTAPSRCSGTGWAPSWPTPWAALLERETYAHAPLTLFVSGRTAPGHRGSLGPPALNCRVVALTAHHDPRAALAGVRAWRRCTSGRFDLEVFPGAQGYLKSHRREVVNIVHDQLISLGAPDPE